MECVPVTGSACAGQNSGSGEACRGKRVVYVMVDDDAEVEACGGAAVTDAAVSAAVGWSLGPNHGRASRAWADRALDGCERLGQDRDGDRRGGRCGSGSRRDPSAATLGLYEELVCDLLRAREESRRLRRRLELQQPAPCPRRRFCSDDDFGLEDSDRCRTWV